MPANGAFYRIPVWLEVGSAGREVGALHLSGMGKQSRFASGSWTQTALTHSSHNIVHRPKTSNNTLQRILSNITIQCRLPNWLIIDVHDSIDSETCKRPASARLVPARPMLSRSTSGLELLDIGRVFLADRNEPPGYARCWPSRSQQSENES